MRFTRPPLLESTDPEYEQTMTEFNASLELVKKSPEEISFQLGLERQFEIVTEFYIGMVWYGITHSHSLEQETKAFNRFAELGRNLEMYKLVKANKA